MSAGGIPLDVSGEGWVFKGAEKVAVAARQLKDGHGEHIEAVWAGTPMVGYPGDTAELVYMRWHYERILYQLKAGIIRATDLP